MILAPAYRCALLDISMEVCDNTDWFDDPTAATAAAREHMLRDDKYVGFTMVEGWFKKKKAGKYLKP